MVRDRTIKNNKWYIIDCKELRLVRVDFDTKHDAYHMLVNTFDKDLNWDIIRGVEASKLKLEFKKRSVTRIVKYRYEPDQLTNQERKNHRTKIRRDAKKKRNRK